MAAIHWTVGAQQDLREIVEYIGRDSVVYAASMAERLITAVERLQQHPQLGRMVPEYKDPTLRELLVGNYRIVYRVKPTRIGVVAVAHASRELLRKLPQAPWDL